MISPQHALQNLQSLIKQSPTDVEWIGLKFITETTSFRMVRNEQLEPPSKTIDFGLRIEVLVNGHYGYCGFSDLSSVSIHQHFAKVVEQTRSLSKQKVFHFKKEQRHFEKGFYKTQMQKNLNQLSLKDLVGILSDCTKEMAVAPQVVQRTAHAMIIETQIHSYCSEGSEQLQDFSAVNFELHATAQVENETQKRSYTFQNQIGSEIFLRHRLLPICRSLGEQSLELLKADNTPEEKLTVILAPDQMTLQIHESIGHPLELDRILGDERNYAGWSHVQALDFGKLKYGSELLNVVFEPHRYSEMASYNFDEAGVRAQKEYLIKNGLLLRGLGSTESQVRSGLDGVANFRSSSWNRPPIDRMANINIEPGKTSLQEMISKTEKGMIIHTNKSWSIDDYRDKFQFGCEYAQWIENGKIIRPLKNPNYRGQSLEFWRNLVDVGDSLEVYGTPFCGKGEPSQVIRVGHSSPYCRFENVDVFGGGK
jgi:predicted Zn-dependent protease